MQDFEVNPYKAEGKFDYNKLADQFGISLIDEKLEQRIKKHAGEVHYTIRRKIFYAHRDMNWLLDEYEKGNKFYVYTGIAPSGSMTVAHLLPFTMAKWLQDKFDVQVYIQIPDEEKYLTKKDPKLTMERAHELSYDAALNVAALGFDPKKTKIFLDTEYSGFMYRQAVRVSKYITFSIIKDAFGFSSDANIGSIFYTSMQAVPAFMKSVEEGRNVPCLIPLGVDQDVHFRVARNAIEKLGYYKPAIMHSKFMPSLKGAEKMSASDPDSAIYLNDGEPAVVKKVNKAITGQQSTAELQKKYGGNPEKCSICQYYRYFFEQNDEKLAKIFEAEKEGTLLAGEHKQDLAQRINRFLSDHRKKKEQIRDKLEGFMLRD